MADALSPPLAGGWDCHVHVIGPRDAYPMVPERHYTPGEASVDALRAHMARQDIDHPVIVQPSVYGTDNRCMIDALRELAGAGRGIAVLKDDVPRDELRRLASAGVRGIRLNLESASVRDPHAIGGALSGWAARIADLGWHIQIYAAPNVIAAVAPVLDRLPVRVVLDHFAMLPATVADDDPRLHAVLALLRGGNAYLKLSAPYRIAAAGAAERAAVARLAQRLVAANPDRIVWASDWPHTNREPGVAAHEVSRYRNIDPASLAADLREWVPDDAVRDGILTVNPARLYA
ncbi:MAG: amidohydrolase family protein [Burkholderiaceae bacterium]